MAIPTGHATMGNFPETQLGQWIRWIATVMIVPALIFLASALLDHDRRVAAIEASRYTSEDARKDRLELAASEAALWRELGALRVLIAELPPHDFVARVDAIENRLRIVELHVARDEAEDD